MALTSLTRTVAVWQSTLTLHDGRRCAASSWSRWPGSACCSNRHWQQFDRQLAPHEEQLLFAHGSEQWSLHEWAQLKLMTTQTV